MPLVRGLIGVDARNDDELVLDLLGGLGQSVHVLEDRILAVGRARADDEHLACVLAGKDFGDLGVKCLLFGGKLGESGISSRISMGIGSLRLNSMAIGASSI